MSSLIHQPHHSPGSKHLRLWIAATVPAIVFAAFLLAPGSVAHKTHLALHGLCAQRPSHSLLIGGATLPMDARMTGIYIGAAVAIGWLVAAGRLRAVRIPSAPTTLTLAVFVVALAVDGLNALLVDLGAHHPYQPSNVLRLVTGILGGTALGIATGHLFAASVWARVDRVRAVVTSPADLLVPIGISLAIGGLATANLPILYAPFALGLLLASVGVFSLLGTIVVVLVSNRGWSHDVIEDLAPLFVAGFAAALVVIAALSWVRFAAELHFGLPQLT